MADQGSRDTDALIAELEERIRVEYAQAEREIREKLVDYYTRYATKNLKWRQWVQEGKKTEDEYKRWMVGQLAVGKRWEEMRDTLAKDLLNVHKIAMSIAKEYCPEVYALNHDYGTFQVEQGSLIDTSYTLYSREAAERIFRGDPQMLPKPGKKTARDIADGKILAWNNRHLQSVAVQAILQGNSIPDIATRLANAVQTDRKTATRSARTMMTNAQNMGRMDSYERAKKMGIPVRKQWLATLDLRTRHEHRELDGMVVDTDKPFKVGKLKIRYPGDPEAPPQLVYNCRCTLIAAVKGYEHDLSDTSLRRDERLGEMSYDEWKKSRKEVHRDILSQERRGDAIRARYIREYRGFGGPVESGRNTTLDIDSRHIQARASFDNDNLKAALGDSYEQFREKVEKAPTRVMYERFASEPTLIKQDGQCYYSPREDSVRWRLENRHGRDQYTVIAHEFGHCFDHKLGRQDGLSYKEVDTINDKCRKGFAGPNTVKARPSSSDEFLAAFRKDMENLEPRVKDKSLRKELEYTNARYNASAGVQDALDGAFGTVDKKIFRWGHGDQYYNRFYENRIKANGREQELKEAYKELGYEVKTVIQARKMSRSYEAASEAWANISSAVTCGGLELEAFQTYMPETLKAYLDIVKRVTE